MEDGLSMRKRIFEKLLTQEDNKRNWEMLCCSSKPLVPFIGAGISAWCYPTWNQLLKKIVEKIFSEKCADIVEEALNCCELPNVENRNEFHWMEEIAECIFDVKRDSYEKIKENFL